MKSLPDQIRDLLNTVGPMTAAEIHRLLPDWSRDRISRALSDMHEAKDRACRVRIKAWTLGGPGERKYPRPVYAVGSARDADKPGATSQAERDKKRRERRRPVAGLINSVWAWAQSFKP